MPLAGQDRFTATERGDVIGGYRLLREIGRGGMAEVWVARRVSSATGKFVALKMVLPQYIGDERHSRMFATEALVSAPLSHSNIVQVFDEGEDNGRSYLVMEWVDGVDLARLHGDMVLLQHRDPYLRLRLAAYIVGQVLYGLSYAHKIESHRGEGLGIVHRDISPQNILISVSGDVKVADFGIAHRMIEETSGLHVKGKLRYMSPEQLGGESHEPTVDLYAVGALLHELLDGKKFRSDVQDQLAMYRDVMTGAIPPLTVTDVPRELEDARRALLQPDPRKRVQTADAALLMLKRWAGYSEMKVELAMLCGVATGVVRPRTGPLGATTAPGAHVRPFGPRAVEVGEPGAPESDAPSVPWRPPSQQPTDVASSESTGTAVLDVSEMPMGTPPRADRTTALEGGASSSRDAAALAAARARDLEPTHSAVQSAWDLASQSAVTDAGESPSRRWWLLLVAFAVLAGSSAAGVVALFSQHDAEDAGEVATGSMQGSVIAPSIDEEDERGIADERGGSAIVADVGRPGPTFAMVPTDDAPADVAVDAPQPANVLPHDPKHESQADANADADLPAEVPQDPPPHAEPKAEPKPAPKSDPKPTPKPGPKPSPKPTSSTKPTAKPQAAPPVADAPQMLVHLRLDKTAFPGGAEVQLGKRIFTIKPHLDAKVAAGRYGAKWRSIGESSWKSAGTIEIGATGEWRLYVSPRGIEVKRL